MLSRSLHWPGAWGLGFSTLVLEELVVQEGDACGAFFTKYCGNAEAGCPAASAGFVGRGHLQRVLMNLFPVRPAAGRVCPGARQHHAGP